MDEYGVELQALVRTLEYSFGFNQLTVKISCFRPTPRRSWIVDDSGSTTVNSPVLDSGSELHADVERGTFVGF